MIRINLKLERDLLPELYDHLDRIQPRLRAEFCRQILSRAWLPQSSIPDPSAPIHRNPHQATPDADYLDQLGDALSAFDSTNV